jgi:cytochrome P450
VDPNLSFDPFDPQHTHHMWDLARRFQREAPVARISADFLFVSRWADVRTVIRDNDRFSNEGGFRPSGVEVPPEDRNLGDIDPPEHGPLRRLAFHAAAGPGVVDGLRPFGQATSRELLQRIRAAGQADLIARFSLALTNLVIARLLGIPDPDTEQVTAWGEEIMMGPLPVTGGMRNLYPAFTNYVEGLIADRLASDDPPDDAIARIVTAAGDAGIPVPMVRMIMVQLLLGGTTTTRDLLGSVCLELLQQPALHEQLRADRSLVPAAVEEGLRLAPPVLFLIRTARRDTELADVAIGAGDRVIAGLAAANRDPDVYEAPDEFRLDRQGAPPHLSFGHGAHLCVGAALARMEAQEALAAFVDEFAPGELRLAPGFTVEHMPAAFLYGPQRVDVEVVASD